MRRIWIAGLLLSLMVIGYGLGNNPRQARSPEPVGETGGREPRVSAPNFDLTDLNGASLTLASSRGKVILLNFWATWCPPCKAEIPHFKELYTQYQPKGLEIIGIALDQGGVADVAPFAREQAINYPLVIGNAQVVESYGGIRGIPTTFLIDKKGRIAAKYVGYQDKQVFEKEIRVLLAENL